MLRAKGLFLILVTAISAEAQKNGVTQATNGSCSPAVIAGANVTITCHGLDQKFVKNIHLVLIKLNQITANRMDAKSVNATLNEIKALVSRGTVSPEVVSQGVTSGLETFVQQQQRQFEKQLNSPKTLARAAYAVVSNYLTALRSYSPMMLTPSEDQLLYAYHAQYDVLVPDALEKLQSRNPQAGDLVALSRNVKSLDDIRRLASGFKGMSDHFMYLQLTMFLKDAERMTKPIPQATETQQISAYRRSSTAAKIDDILAKLQSKHIPVDNLLRIQNNIASVADIQRLADGFKALADSWPSS